MMFHRANSHRVIQNNRKRAEWRTFTERGEYVHGKRTRKNVITRQGGVAKKIEKPLNDKRKKMPDWTKEDPRHTREAKVSRGEADHTDHL